MYSTQTQHEISFAPNMQCSVWVWGQQETGGAVRTVVSSAGDIWVKNEDSVWRSTANTHCTNTFVQSFVETNVLNPSIYSTKTHTKINWPYMGANKNGIPCSLQSQCCIILNGSRHTVAVDGNRLISYLSSTLIAPLVLLLLLLTESNLQAHWDTTTSSVKSFPAWIWSGDEKKKWPERSSTVLIKKIPRAEYANSTA